MWVVRFFLFMLCSLCLIAVFALTKLYPITRAVHTKILDATEALDAGGTVDDPVTGKKITRKVDTPNALQLEHFTAAESKASGTLVMRLGLRLFLWVGIFVAFVIAMAVTTGSAQQYIVSVCAICCSAIFVLVPYDGVRLRVAMLLSKGKVASMEAT